MVYQQEKVLVMQDMQDTLYDHPRTAYVVQGAYKDLPFLFWILEYYWFVPFSCFSYLVCLPYIKMGTWPPKWILLTDVLKYPPIKG